MNRVGDPEFYPEADPAPDLSRTAVSIIIPTLNGGPAFRGCLAGIWQQVGVGQTEIIVLDSGSEDGTPEFAARTGARVIPVARAAFNHGMVRDQGAREAGGEVLVFTVQDALPADSHWLYHLVRPLLDGASAATSRIMPRPDANPLARRTALESPMAEDAPFEADPSRIDLDGIPLEEIRRFARFDDIASAIRADVYPEVPFRPLAMSEDLQWVMDALRSGHRVVFAHRSVVYHSHEYTPAAIYRRYLDDAVATWQILGIQARTGPWHGLRGYAYEVLRDFRFLMKMGPRALVKYGLCSLVIRAFQVAGQMKGSP